MGPYMTFPVRHLPVVQNWDCHVCGSCCKEYLVTVSDEERRRIESQGWDNDPDLGRTPIFIKSGPWWRRRYRLNHRADGSCVFLSEQGRCRIHEKIGYQAKPLPCRLFPFVLVPAGDHWRVGMRFACPSAAGNKGRALTGHAENLKQFAAELAQREGLDLRPEVTMALRPRLQPRRRIDWPDLLRIVQTLLTILGDRHDRVERRIRKCLALADLCRQASLEQLQGKRLSEFLQIITSSLESEVPADPARLPPPNWVGRILFRQAVALFTRKDHGPDQGMARRGRVALLRAAWRFVRGSGVVPQLHKKIPEVTFGQVEAASSVLPADAEEVLERYYTVKVESLQFFGPANMNLPFWQGLEVLALTFPILMWVTRSLAQEKPADAVTRALTIVDDHFGFNPVLRFRRQRISFGLLARTGELVKLVGWYGR
jgi:lysine-N-methylase